MADFILEVPRYKQAENRPIIRITPEAYAVLTEICAKTAIPMSKVASQAVLYAAQHLQIKRIGEEDENESY